MLEKYLIDNLKINGLVFQLVRGKLELQHK